MTPEIVQQIWAEAAILAKAGEKLYLPPELEAFAQKEQRAAMEQDDREGLVLEYLDTLLPDGWNSMDIYKRRDYINEPDDPTRPVGKHRRTEVSNIEIWCECFGRNKEDFKGTEQYSIAAIMEHLDDWEKTGRSKRLPIYGKQRMYRRK